VSWETTVSLLYYLRGKKLTLLVFFVPHFGIYFLLIILCPLKNSESVLIISSEQRFKNKLILSFCPYSLLLSYTFRICFSFLSSFFRPVFVLLIFLSFFFSFVSFAPFIYFVIFLFHYFFSSIFTVPFVPIFSFHLSFFCHFSFFIPSFLYSFIFPFFSCIMT
jgi:hypothetical protein